MKQILLRVTDEQHAQWKEQAADIGLSVQKYLQTRLSEENVKKSRSQLLCRTEKNKELRVLLPDALHGQLKISAAYHHWTMQEEARAIFADALTGALVAYPKEVKAIQQCRRAIDKIGRNILSGIRTGMIEGRDGLALLEELKTHTELLRAYMDTIQRKSRWNRGD